jgi:hypothetical protein
VILVSYKIHVSETVCNPKGKLEKADLNHQTSNINTIDKVQETSSSKMEALCSSETLA